VIARHNGQLVSLGNPTTSLEDLFLRIIRESEAHPGRRVHATAESSQAGQNEGTPVHG
jgi:ABC-2 type transport system ATP-binding protein